MRKAIRFISILLLMLCDVFPNGAPHATKAAATHKSLDIYFIDVEGGAATLLVTPAGESILIDSGWKRDDDRDAKRIHYVATKEARLVQIDHQITTHWHRDHFGGLGRLSELLPIKHFYHHHGIPDRLAEDPESFPVLIAAYKKVTNGQSHVLRPGDELPLINAEASKTPRVRIQCLASNGEVLPEIKTAPVNPLCEQAVSKPEDTTDNARSVSILLTFGPFKFLDCGDLTWNIEKNLVCPTNKIGPVDVYQVNHHGMAISNNPVFVRSVNPRVAILNNGPRKGGDASTYALLRSQPEIKAVYALHRNVQTTDKDNPAPEFIANLEEACQGEFIKLSVDPTGKRYTVSIGSKGTKRTYLTR